MNARQVKWIAIAIESPQKANLKLKLKRLGHMDAALKTQISVRTRVHVSSSQVALLLSPFLFGPNFAAVLRSKSSLRRKDHLRFGMIDIDWEGPMQSRVCIPTERWDPSLVLEMAELSRLDTNATFVSETKTMNDAKNLRIDASLLTRFQTSLEECRTPSLSFMGMSNHVHLEFGLPQMCLSQSSYTLVPQQVWNPTLVEFDQALKTAEGLCVYGIVFLDSPLSEFDLVVTVGLEISRGASSDPRSLSLQEGCSWQESREFRERD